MCRGVCVANHKYPVSIHSAEIQTIHHCWLERAFSVDHSMGGQCPVNETIHKSFAVHFFPSPTKKRRQKRKQKWKKRVESKTKNRHERCARTKWSLSLIRTVMYCPLFIVCVCAVCMGVRVKYIVYNLCKPNLTRWSRQRVCLCATYTKWDKYVFSSLPHNTAAKEEKRNGFCVGLSGPWIVQISFGRYGRASVLDSVVSLLLLLRLPNKFHIKNCCHVWVSSLSLSILAALILSGVSILPPKR